MTVTILEPGRKVQVGPEPPNVGDVLEYAEALVEAYGWTKGPRSRKDDLSERKRTGFTLHDAIGFACEELSETASGSRQKDWSSADRNLRTEATEAVVAVLPAGQTDLTWNDNIATSAQDLIDVLRRAREEVTSAAAGSSSQ